MLKLVKIPHLMLMALTMLLRMITPVFWTERMPARQMVPVGLAIWKPSMMMLLEYSRSMASAVLLLRSMIAAPGSALNVMGAVGVPLTGWSQPTTNPA